MALTIKDILESKGIQAEPEHLVNLEQRWKEMQELRKSLEGVLIEDADIALRSIPGGEENE